MSAQQDGPELLHMVRFAATRFARDLAGWLRWHVRRGALDLAGTGTGGPEPDIRFCKRGSFAKRVGIGP